MSIEKVVSVFEEHDKAIAKSLQKDVTEAIASAVAGGYVEVYVFTNAYPRSIFEVKSKLDLSGLREVGIKKLIIINPSQELEQKLRREASLSDIPRLFVTSHHKFAEKKVLGA